MRQCRRVGVSALALDTALACAVYCIQYTQYSIRQQASTSADHLRRYKLHSTQQQRESVQRLPKIELHRHLVGSLRTSTLLDVAREYGIELLTLDFAKLDQLVTVQPDDVKQLGPVLAKMGKIIRLCFPSSAAIRRFVVEMVEDAWAENIVYLEVRFAPAYMASSNGLGFEQIIASVLEGLGEATARYPILCAGIIGLSRDLPLPDFARTVDVAMEFAGDPRIVGVDLSGDEAAAPARQFRAAFEQIRKDGRLGITVHAGEGVGAESVAAAIEQLGAQRIGHGVRAVEDPDVLTLAKGRGVVFEVCPSSNVLTGAVPDLAHHPLKLLLENGLVATINTDDPRWFGVDLTDEYCLVLDELGLSWDQLRQAVLNAAAGAFQPEYVRGDLISRIEREFHHA